MGDVIRKKLNRYTRALICCALGLYLIALWSLYQYQSNHMDHRRMRVEVNQLLSDFEQGMRVEEKEYSFPYCIIDDSNQVLVSTIDGMKVNQFVNVHKLGNMNAYIVPTNRSDIGSVILFADCSAMIQEKLRQRFLRASIPLHLLFFVFLLFLALKKKVEKEDIWTPIHNLHLVTKDMMRGKFDTSVYYDYDGAIGSLCHDFESMRNEILSGYQRENRAKEKEKELYASISHDLKTPIASIRGYLEEILYGVITEPNEVHSAMERMLQKSVILTELIDDILEHSKAELNQLNIVKEEVYAADYFENLLSGYASDAKLHDYEFLYTLPSNVLIALDQRRIAEVMQNLIENAVKYRAGKLRIQVTFEEMKDPEPMLIVNVSDNGSGIDAADQPFIFDLFFRGNKARSQDIPGSGLGLNIVKYIVEQHCGQIQCDSIAGVGTTISFSIPMK